MSSASTQPAAGNAEFGFLVLTPGGTPDPALAIAGSRAGGIGVLNLEFAWDVAAAEMALNALATHARLAIGVLVDPANEPMVEMVLSASAPRIALLVVTSSGECETARFARMVKRAHRRGAKVLLQVSSAEAARAGEEAGVDGLIAKGHEAGGWVGEETTFVLLQRLLDQTQLPIWAQGGIGRHTAAACAAAGAAGVVLDNQLLLARESPLPESLRAELGRLDGSETACSGVAFGAAFRAYSRPGRVGVDEMGREEAGVALLQQPEPARKATWRRLVAPRVDWRGQPGTVLPIGQDIAFAAGLARRFGTVGGIIACLRKAVAESGIAARETRPLAEGAPLAKSHGTRFSIVQGPMTRVSDQPGFADAVASAGGLPFLALALMRGPEARSLLEETRERLAGRPWGVGILGFVPPDLRAEQLAVIHEVRPPYALIAGGRPDQAQGLEAAGIPTYLHVPSPVLLRLFLDDGARRFVFEGRECGGHVGPRTSFVLWESMVDVLLEAFPRGEDPSGCHVLFAGGVHDARSAAMVAAVAAPLTQRGMRVGVLIGTAYLFTDEAVSSGAITETFQQTAVECTETVLLESGPGQATRCAPSAFTHEFEEHKRRLQNAVGAQDLKDELESFNIGRLRIAAKGVDRNPVQASDPRAPRFVVVSPDDQRTRGMYMLGQVASLRNRTCSVAELHRDVAHGSTALLESLAVSASSERPAEAPEPVAIVGMGTILPGAPDLAAYWRNILDRVDAVREVPADRWDWRVYFHEDPATRDRVYSRWGGFIDPVPFDPIAFGMPPGSLSSIETVHLLTLVVVREALRDAGFLDRPFPRERTSVILGAGGGAGDLGAGYITRSSLPGLLGQDGHELVERLGSALPEWTEDSFPGILMNVAAGRVANRFDLGGVNYTVDAACASALAAVYNGVQELRAGTSDVAIVGGIDALQNPFAYLCFAKTHALSPTGRCRTFDADGDGIAISEGLAVVVLKRLSDAERDGDRIYAVIRAVAGSSDGRDKGLTAPRPEGQMRALRRAYAQAGFAPTSVELFEAHGTGTVVGDLTEAQSLSQLLGEYPSSGARTAALGSVKSMIGHTKAAAGVAGLVKVALALHHGVLPATINVQQPNPKVRFSETPLYLNTETRPWLRRSGASRRAAVSSFGFGGTNFHVVLEEYTGSYLPDEQPTRDLWPAEVCVWRGATRAEVRAAAERTLSQIEAGASPRLVDLAYSLGLAADAADRAAPTLALVATSLDDLRAKLPRALDLLSGSATQQHDPAHGIHWSEEPLAGTGGGVAFLFPGQGSQYVNMARDLAVTFPVVRESLERADEALGGRLGRPLSDYIFPIPVFSDEDRQRQQAELTDTSVAQPALGAVDLALLALLRELGLRPDLVAGHSYGELVALCAAGVMAEDDLLRISEARGRFMREGADDGESGTMAAIGAEAPAVRDALSSLPAIVLANMNAPRQTVISGPRPDVERAVAACELQGWSARLLPVACAFHSPLVAPAQQRLAMCLRELRLASPGVAVYGNSTAERYPAEPSAIVEQLSQHLLCPVEWVRQVRAMHDAGARLFVEVGPGSVLSGLTTQILEGRPHATASLDQRGRPGLRQLLEGLATAAAEGASLQVERLFVGRGAQRLDLNRLDAGGSASVHSPTTWLVHGGRAWPAKAESAPSVSRPSITISAPSEEVLPVAEHRTNGHDPSALALASAPPPAVPPPPLAPPAAPSAPSLSEHATPQPYGGNGVGLVMQQYQQVMHHFLDTQASVMQAYLQAHQGTPARSIAAPPAPAWQQLNAPLPLPRPSAPGLPRPVVDGVARLAEPTPSAPPIAAADADLPPMPVPAAPAALIPTAAPVAPRASEAGATAPAVEAPLAVATPPTRDALIARVRGLVADRTGYPPEMLGHDVDLEADLGIDSIKRVEIVGTLLRTLNLPDGQKPDMERLTASRTLSRIVEEVISFLETAAPTQDPQETARPFELVPTDRTTVGRHILQVVEAAPTSTAGLALAPGRAIVVVDDDQDLGETVATRLEALGHRVIRLSTERDLGAPDDGASREVVQRIHERSGPVGGFIHLAPLRPGAPLGFEQQAWAERLAGDVTWLHLLTRALFSDLEAAAAAGGAFVLGATALGGGFGADGLPADAFPGAGAVAGFLKSLAHEAPAGLRVKSVDLSAAPVEDRARWLMAEIGAEDGLVEVGYRGGRRMCIQPVAQPLPPLASSPAPLGPDSVVLLTGGARGITAEVALALAERYQPSLVLVGRTDLGMPEPPELDGLRAPADLRRALLTLQAQAGGNVHPGKVEAAYQQLARAREGRNTLERLRAAGARVAYYACDVSDQLAFAGLLRDIYAAHGRIDGVIHGAGAIEDRLVRDKTWESFKRVMSPKVDGLLTLARELRPQGLRFLVLFSSFSARFGNKGQADYAAANEVLNKIALTLNERWTATRVASINWGPWLAGSMVSEEVKRQFEERGVALIESADGCSRLIDELERGSKAAVEVVIGGWREAAHPSVKTQRPHPALGPLLLDADRIDRSSEAVTVQRTFSLDRDPFLDDHRLDGSPVVPLATAMELMAEAALVVGGPSGRLRAIRDVRLLKGVILPTGQPASVRVRAQGGAVGSTVDVTITSETSTGALIRHYQATVEVGSPGQADRDGVPPALVDAAPFPLAIDAAYRDWLFHGPRLQRIEAITSMGPLGARALLRPSAPTEALADVADAGEWLLDPLLLDAAFQVQLLWARRYWNVTSLPAAVGAFVPQSDLVRQSFRAAARTRRETDREPLIRCELRLRPESANPISHADFFLFAPDGELLARAEDVTMVGSAALNRVGAAPNQMDRAVLAAGATNRDA